MKLEFSRQIFEKYPKHKIFEKYPKHKISSPVEVKSELFPREQRVRSVNVTIRLQVLSSSRTNGALPRRFNILSRRVAFINTCRILPVRHCMMKYSVLWLRHYMMIYSVLWLDQELDPPDIASVSLILLSVSQALP